MPALGAHMSIRGGLHLSLRRGKEVGCRVIQIFTHNTNQWAVRPLTHPEIEAFRKAKEETSIPAVAAHDSYLINIASPDDEIRRKSLEALVREVERADALEIPYVVMHPGAHLGEGEGRGLKRISDGLEAVFDRTSRSPVRILLETTAGQGTNLGSRFEQLAEIIEGTGSGERLGICLDTCHVFAAGYDFRTDDAYRRLKRELKRTVGLERVKLVHVNDAKRYLGSRVDRHEHVGRGFIGETAFTFFLRDPTFKETPFLLETPKGRNEAGVDWDVINLGVLERLSVG